MRGSLLSKMLVRSMMLLTYTLLLMVFGIVLILALKSVSFFRLVSPANVFFTTQWSLQENLFSVYPLFLGTLLIVCIALCTAFPIALLASIYLSEYMPKRWAYRIRPLLEVLAGVPTVVYGFLAILLIGPSIRSFGQALGIQASGESALAAGIAMGIMLIPFMVSLLTDAFQSVPSSLRDGAYALGSTRSEAIWHIVLPACGADILGVLLLSISRGIGETMIVVMAAGLSASMTADIFKSVTTITAQIVSILLGDQEYASPRVLAAFMLGLLLFLLTLMLNTIALLFMKRKRERYE